MNSSSDRNILAEGSDEYGRIARKLRRVSGAFDRRWAPGELPKGVSAKVEELTAEYERIEYNRARLREVKLHYKHNDADGVGLNDDIYKAIKDFPKKKSPNMK